MSTARSNVHRFPTKRRRPGRPCLFGAVAGKSFEIRLTEQQLADLREVAADNNTTPTDVVRTAINTYVQDYRERAFFRKPERDAA